MSEHHYVQVNPILGDRQATGGENGHFLHCCSQQCMLTPTAVLSDHTYLWQSLMFIGLRMTQQPPQFSLTKKKV